MAIELKNLTKRSENYSQWYNELVAKADLAEQSAVRGCMVIKPYGYAIWEKIQQTLDRMVKEAKKAGIPFDFVLFDTWFSNPAQLVELKGMDVDTIAMIKKNSTKYLWTDPETGKQSRLDVKEIYSRSKKRRGKSRYLLSVNVTVTGSEGNAILAKLVYARNRSNRKDWVCFVCTDTSLSEREILETYMLR